MSSNIDKLSTEEKVDLAISLMIFQIEPAVILANACLENISQVEFQSACYQLIKTTNYYETLTEKPLHFIDDKGLAIGIISRYLFRTKKGISGEHLRKKILEITNNIEEDHYGAWEICLYSCNGYGRYGPTLEECKEGYDSWKIDLTRRQLFTISLFFTFFRFFSK